MIEFANTVAKNAIVDGYLVLESLVSVSGIEAARCLDISTSLFSGFYKFRMLNERDADREAHNYFQRLKLLSERVVYPDGRLFLREGSFHGSPYFIEKYVWGEQLISLQRRIKASNRGLGPAFAALVGYKISRIFRSVIQNSGDLPPVSVHGHLSPRNVIIGYDGEVFIVNYGLTVPQSLDCFPGSPQDDPGRFSLGVNLFSLGVLMLEISIGLYPFSKMPLSKQWEAFQALEPQGLDAMISKLPEPFGDVVMKALNAEYDSYETFEADLYGYFKSIRINPSYRHVFYLMNELLQEDMMGELGMLGEMGEHNPLLEKRIRGFMVQIIHDILKAQIFD